MKKSKSKKPTIKKFFIISFFLYSLNIKPKKILNVKKFIIKKSYGGKLKEEMAPKINKKNNFIKDFFFNLIQ